MATSNVPSRTSPASGASAFSACMVLPRFGCVIIWESSLLVGQYTPSAMNWGVRSSVDAAWRLLGEVRAVGAVLALSAHDESRPAIELNRRGERAVGHEFVSDRVGVCLLLEARTA